VKTVLVAQPAAGSVFVKRSYDAALKAIAADDRDHMGVPIRPEHSILTKNFNDCVAGCLNGGYDYFAMLHADVSAADGWLTALLREMNTAGVDVIHAPVCICDGGGLTSTAVACDEGDWDLPRRISTTELKQLPATFTVEDVRRELEPDARWLLPNTGCMVIRTRVLYDFPGFEIKDRLYRNHAGEWGADFLPEDWNFGIWCGRNDIAVAGSTIVETNHHKRVPVSSGIAYGQSTDMIYQRVKQAFAKGHTNEV